MEVDKAEGHHQEEPTGCNFGGVLTFGVGLVAGTFSAVVCKMLYETSSNGLDGTEKLFGKPIMVLLLMFASMVPALLFYGIQQAFLEPKDRDVISKKTLIVLMIPSICDLLCTLLLLVAQLYITASMWQMLRGSVIIITAILKRVVLNHRLRMHMWSGTHI
jgi:drug/metabolite transporter (DMT)-like permease